jgi:hypothetical protein
MIVYFRFSTLVIQWYVTMMCLDNLTWTQKNLRTQKQTRGVFPTCTQKRMILLFHYFEELKLCQLTKKEPCHVHAVNINYKDFLVLTRHVWQSYAMNTQQNPLLDSPIMIFMCVGGVTSCIMHIRSLHTQTCM